MRNSKSKRHHLYNYIVNTFGFSKEHILELVETRLTDIVDKHVGDILNSNKFEILISNRLTDVFKNGFDNGHFKRTTFNDLVNAKIDEILITRLKSEYEIELKAVKKTDKVISVRR